MPRDVAGQNLVHLHVDLIDNWNLEENIAVMPSYLGPLALYGRDSTVDPFCEIKFFDFVIFVIHERHGHKIAQ